MESISVICLFIMCLCTVVNCNEKQKFTTFAKRTFTIPDSTEDEDGQKLASPKVLCRYALTTAREVFDMQTNFLIGVIQQFQKIKRKNNFTWEEKFGNVLMNCQSIMDENQAEIKIRLADRKDPPDFTTNPLKPADISNLIHNFNHMMIILQDEELKDVNEEVQAIRSLLDYAEAELHRFNFRIRSVMKRIAKRLSSTTTSNGTDNQTTPSIR